MERLVPEAVPTSELEEAPAGVVVEWHPDREGSARLRVTPGGAAGWGSGRRQVSLQGVLAEGSVRVSLALGANLAAWAQLEGQADEAGWPYETAGAEGKESQPGEKHFDCTEMTVSRRSAIGWSIRGFWRG